MALAYLAYRHSANGNFYYTADIGTQDFFQFKTGRQKRKYQGLELIEEETFVSAIHQVNKSNDVFGPQFTLAVAHTLFTDGGNFIQLWSYRTPEKTGPAISAVLPVPLLNREAGDVFPFISLSTITEPMEPIKVRNEAFSYMEKGISEGMFWNQLLNALPAIIDNAMPVLRPLLGGNGSGNGTGSAGSAPSSGAENSPNNLLNAIQQLVQNIRQISGNNGAPVGDAPSPVAADSPNGSSAPAGPTAQSGSGSFYGLSQSLGNIAKRTISEDTLKIIQDNPRQMGQILNDSLLRMGSHPRAPYHLSEAKIAWAPIIAAVAPLVKDILELGSKDQADQRRHLEQLAELLNDPGLTALLASMSNVPTKRKFVPGTLLYIDTSHLQKINLHQHDRVVFQHGKALTIPFRLATERSNPPARPIPKAIVQVSIQETEHLTVLWKKEFKVKEVVINSLVNVITILPGESQNLPANQDLKVEITFLWLGKDQNKSYGTVKNQFITLVKESIFDRIGEKAGSSVALNDLVKYRFLWHKVWEGGYSESRRWHIDFDAKYYYAFELDEEDPARLETRLKVMEDNAEADEEMPGRRKVRAKLKSGMKVPAEIFNSLLPGHGYPKLSAGQLEAIKTNAFQQYMNQVARVHLEMEGKSGDTAALWVYPEVDIHQVHLLTIDKTTEHGQVIAMSPQTVHFPRPSSIHFIGTKSL